MGEKLKRLVTEIYLKALSHAKKGNGSIGFVDVEDEQPSIFPAISADGCVLLLRFLVVTLCCRRWSVVLGKGISARPDNSHFAASVPSRSPSPSLLFHGRRGFQKKSEHEIKKPTSEKQPDVRFVGRAKER